MAAPLNLTGRKFGRLRVLRANGRVKFGRDQTAWLVECNCGRQEVLAQALLTSRGWVECSYCQRPECVMCREKVPASRPRSNTCSDDCQRGKMRARWRDSYHRRASPEFNRARHQRTLERMAADIELAERIRAIRRAAGTRWRTNPENREAIRSYQARRYVSLREEIQAKRRARISSMTAEQLEHWRARIREYQRLYAQRYRAVIRTDPARHREYLDRMREYRRRQHQKLE